MKKTIALLLLVLPLFAVAQISFQPGYIIENGVKKECLIKNLAWKNNPVSIEYKNTPEEDAKVKSIKDISEFSVDNAYKYRRYTVNIDRSETVLGRMNDNKEPVWKNEVLFLKVVVEGKINLYQYEENNFAKYFYSEADHNKAEQLVYKQYEAQNYLLENNTFRQQLYNLMKDEYPDMKKFENIRYKKSQLVKLFSDYNGISGKAVNNLSEKQNKSSVHLKLTPGVTFTSVSIDNEVNNVSYDFENKTGFRIGAEIELVLPFNNNKWSLFTEPNFQSYSDNGTKNDVTAAIEYKSVMIPAGARYYMYLNPNSKFFVDASYGIAILIGESSIEYQKVYGSKWKLDISNYSAFSFGAGFEYSKYSIAGRFSTSNGLLSQYALWGSKNTSFAIILGYKIL